MHQYGSNQNKLTCDNMNPRLRIDISLISKIKKFVLNFFNWLSLLNGKNVRTKIRIFCSSRMNQKVVKTIKNLKILAKGNPKVRFSGSRYIVVFSSLGNSHPYDRFHQFCSNSHWSCLFDLKDMSFTKASFQVEILKLSLFFHILNQLETVCCSLFNKTENQFKEPQSLASLRIVTCELNMSMLVPNHNVQFVLVDPVLEKTMTVTIYFTSNNIWWSIWYSYHTAL